MNHHMPAARPRKYRPAALGAYLILLPAAGLLAAACSGAASTAPPAASPKASTPAASTPAAAAASSASPAARATCKDSCGQNEPVSFVAGSYTGTDPAQITINGTACTGLAWSSWPSGPGGSVPSGSSVKGTGKASINGAVVPVTITLDEPVAAMPAFWQQLELQVQGQPAKIYQTSATGSWTYVAGNSQFPAAQISASGGNQP